MKEVFYEELELKKKEPVSQKQEERNEEKVEDIIDSIFEETSHWASQRIMMLGEWIPMAGCYVSYGEDRCDWFSEDTISILLQDDKQRDFFIHLKPEDPEDLLEKMKEANQRKQKKIIFNGQEVPVTSDTIKDVSQKLEKIKSIIKPRGNGNGGEKLPKLIPLIKDNIQDLIYERDKREPFLFEKTFPDTLNIKEIYTYQKEGINWLQENFLKRNAGVILADDMGLGKTLQVLVFLAWLNKVHEERKTSQKKPFLVVAPKALLKNWEDESQKHLIGFGKAFKGYGERLRLKSRGEILDSFKSYSWTITTYETLRDKEVFFRQIDWGVCIFDEAQKIKNPNSLLSRMAAAMSSDFSIAITGTPIENDLIDLWCIADCVYPKKLGLLKDFKKDYCKKEDRYTQLKKDVLEGAPPFMIKRWKSDVLTSKGLPQKKILYYEEKMLEKQKLVYDQILKNTENHLYNNYLVPLQELMKYSLFIDDQVSDADFEEDNIKIKTLCKIINQIKNKDEKVLIFLKNRMLQRKLIAF